MPALIWTPATELARMIATKAVSPVDVVRAHLEHVERLEPTLHAFITVCADAALEAARAAEAALTTGQPLGPLHGVPVALKDLYETRGVRTTAGSRILADHVPDRDAGVVARLGAAGAIVLGKLNMHEFAYGPEGLNEHYGQTRNQWDAAVARIPGGSSSGSGAAVAAGMVPAALGSDTGGSIRIPASLCGITGIKPTYGRVSRAGVLPLAWSLDHAGPMARTAADCALLLSVMAGYDAADPTTSVLPVPDYTAALGRDVKGLRVGRLRGLFAEGLAADVQAGIDAAARQLQSLGAVVDDLTLPHVEHVPAAAFAIMAAEALAYHAPWMRTRAADYQQDVRERLFAGALVSGVHYVRGQQVRALLRAAVDDALAHRDVLLAPTTACAATPLGERSSIVDGRAVDVRSALLRFTRIFNLSGHPVCSVPCGFTGEGQPFGMQIVGRAFDEVTVLRVADAWQRTTDWHTRRPPLGGEETR